LIRDAFKRLRAADGFSHGRSLAFISEMVLVQGIIARCRLEALASSPLIHGLQARQTRSSAPGT
jgi:hypothetical protein